ncbi:DUF4268 domain-containing protein [Rhizobium leguminosarum]|nr:DUF4268 domain-containing protein [Rhizobium leguminosarum]TAV56992.1 DUF4268 domain-containing protein [Rhizobium leguminosarum]TAV67930.1 DUF4268 domain-containing protein [Rhizobium leguminosarum]
MFVSLEGFGDARDGAGLVIAAGNLLVDGQSCDRLAAQTRRHQLRLQFWARALERLRADGITLFANVNPSRDHWLNAGSGVRGCPFTMIFARDEARVEVNLARVDRDENKWLFDQLEADRSAIEARFGGEMSWLRLDERKQSRISYSHPFDGYEVDNWPEMLVWLSEHIRKLEGAFRQPLAQYARSIPSVDESGTGETNILI